MGFPESPTGAVAESWVRRPPDTPTSARAPPPPRSPLRPPRARGGGSGVSRRHCSPSSALHHVRKKRFFTRRGRGRAAFSRRSESEGSPAEGEGAGGAERRRGGGPDSEWEGRGAAQRQPPPPPRARLNFLYSPERYLPLAPLSCDGLHRGGRAAELGGQLPNAARFLGRGSKLSGAASLTAIFPGKRPRRRRRFLHLLATAPRLASSPALAAPLA